IQDVRDLEPPPTHHPRIKALQADEFALPLSDASCDVVVFGFGTHEIPRDGPLQKVFQEARRILKPGGKVLMFEHGYDFHNYLIFGPVCHHVTTRRDWLALLREHFAALAIALTSWRRGSAPRNHARPSPSRRLASQMTANFSLPWLISLEMASAATL